MITRTLLILLVFLIPYGLYAANNIEELDGGSCWLQESNYDYIKVASFNDGVASTIGREEFAELFKRVEKELVKNGLEYSGGEKIEIFYFCSGMGGHLVLNIHRNDFGVCIWNKIRSGEIEFMHMGVEPDNDLGLCDGYVPGYLIVTLSSEVQDVGLFIEELEAIDSIESVNKSSPNSLKLKLKSSYFFKEKDVAAELYKKFPEELKSVDFEFYYHSIGDYKKLQMANQP